MPDSISPRCTVSNYLIDWLEDVFIASYHAYHVFKYSNVIIVLYLFLSYNIKI